MIIDVFRLNLGEIGIQMSLQVQMINYALVKYFLLI